MRGNYSTFNSNNTISYQRCHFLTFNTDRLRQVRNVYLASASLDIILILPTIVLNVLLIISLYRSGEIRKPSMKLLFSLAMSDVLVGLAMEPTFLAKKLAEINSDFTLYCRAGLITYVVGGGLSAVSLFTLTVIAIDRFLLIHTGKDYRSLVTNTRVTLVILGIWLSMFTLFSAQLYSPRPLYFKVGAAVMFAMILIISTCYIKCFSTLKKQQREAIILFEGCLNQKCSMVNNYKKSINTMVYVFLAFLLCNLPHACVFVIAGVVRESAGLWTAETFGCIAIYANSLINPILLIWTTSSLRLAAVKSLLRSPRTAPRKTPVPAPTAHAVPAQIGHLPAL